MNDIVKVKLVTVGEMGSGKTSLVMRLLNDRFCTTESTIGASFFTYTYDAVKYEIWDTAGSERFAPLSPMYYREADIFVLLFDVSNRDFLNRLLYFLNSIIHHNTNAKIILLGNKIDKITEYDLSFIENLVFANLISPHIVDYIYISTMRGDNFNNFKNVLFNVGAQVRNKKLDEPSKEIIILDEKKNMCSCNQ